MNDGAIIISAGIPDTTLPIWLYDATTGALKPLLTITDLNIDYIRIQDNNTVTVAGETNLTSLTGLTDAHDDNKAFEIGHGAYRLDIPDAAFAKGVIGGSIIITHDGDLVLPAKIDWQSNPAVAFCTSVASVDEADFKFILVDSPGFDDAFINMVMTITDISGAVKASQRVIAYTHSTKLIEVDDDYEFSVTAGDIVTVWADTYYQTASAAAIQDIADAVWDELIAGHLNAGSTGEALNRKRPFTWNGS